MSECRLYMCLSVRGAIRNLHNQRGEKTGFHFEDGRPMNRDQAIDALMDELAHGLQTLPMHAGCGNPCENSTQCNGFDFGEHGGCPGYPIEAPQTGEQAP